MLISDLVNGNVRFGIQQGNIQEREQLCDVFGMFCVLLMSSVGCWYVEKFKKVEFVKKYKTKRILKRPLFKISLPLFLTLSFSSRSDINLQRRKTLTIAIQEGFNFIITS